MTKLSARLQSGRKALGRLAERKAFDSYMRRGAVPDVLSALSAAAADEQKFLDLCAGLSCKALSDGRPTSHYTRRTAGDEKVRHSHVQLGGKVFAWTSPPEGGHPGAAHNCRCWAEPYYGDPSVPDTLLQLLPERLLPKDTSAFWSIAETLKRPDGSIAASKIAMADNTAILSSFAGQHVSQTVLLPDDVSYQSERIGEARHVSIRRSGKVLARVAGAGRALLPGVLPPPSPPMGAPPISPQRFPGESAPLDQMATPFAIMVRGALALYNSAVATPEPMGLGDADLPVFAIKVWQGSGSKDKVVVSAETLTVEQVAQTCKLLPEVQDWTDSAAMALAPMRATSSPQSWGTAVHKAVNDWITALKDMFPARYSNVFSELSVSLEGNHSDPTDGSIHYGQLGTSRLDILERVDQATVCIYDIKTGKRELSFNRAEDFITRASKMAGVVNVIVVQVGITWLPSGR